MQEIGKILLVVGIAVTLIGLLLWEGVGRSWLGRLPGDIHYTRGTFSFYFPIVTCVLMSLILTFLMWLFRR